MTSSSRSGLHGPTPASFHRRLLLAGVGALALACSTASVPAPTASTPRPDTVTTISAPPTGGFRGSAVLGVPTGASIAVNVYAADQSGTVSVLLGTQPGVYTHETGSVPLVADVPVEVSVGNLTADMRYFYRVAYRAPDGSRGSTPEASFHTARSRGRTFTFGIQGDSHPERDRTQFDATLYERTLRTAASDSLDFYVMLGDDFSVDLLDRATISEAAVRARYTLQRPWLGIIGAMSPLYLVNGNHEQAARYLLNGTPNSVAVWAQNARNTLYSQPAPSGFYSGNGEQVPHIGLLRNYFAWEWGDALFVVLDPYWGSATCVDSPFFGGEKRTDLWEITHGDAQYQWLKSTLERSTARYKFVFAHHVLGTGRGGAERALLYEWGGRGQGGANDFRARRPTWAAPIHDLFVANKVTAFFQGHDHIWVREQLDGVTYQTVSEPADPYYTLYNADAFNGEVELPNSGYTRVTVGPTGVKVEYVRTYKPSDESPSQRNGGVAYSYVLP